MLITLQILVFDRKYLSFIWNGQLHQFTCLPSGLTSALRGFTKNLKPKFAQFRSEGYIAVYYLDDTLLMGRTESECLVNARVTDPDLQKVGFMINTEES